VEDGHVRFDVGFERAPAIYLDQFAIHKFASNRECKRRFLSALRTRGELLFSSINLMEVAALEGSSAHRVRDFLAEIGPYWVPLEFDAFKVTTGPLGWTIESGTPHAALAGELLQELYLASRGSPDSVSLAAAMDIYAQDPQTHREALRVMKADMSRAVKTWRAMYLAAPDRLDSTFPVVRKAGPVVAATSALVRMIASEAKSHTWTLNDAFDFTHAIVPVVFADLIFLDRHWKRRVERLPPGVTRAEVFYAPQTDKFLDRLEAW
jgi:hypothetical protein